MTYVRVSRNAITGMPLWHYAKCPSAQSAIYKSEHDEIPEGADLCARCFPILLCEWCKRPFQQKGQRGPRPKYCKPSHRERAYEARAGIRNSTIKSLNYVWCDYHAEIHSKTKWYGDEACNEGVWRTVFVKGAKGEEF